MAEPDDVTLGELGRRIDGLSRHVDAKFEALHHQLDSAHYLPMALYESEARAQNARIDAIDESLRWVRRTVFGAVIVFVIPVVLAALSIRQGS